jgi:hypothetical protein
MADNDTPEENSILTATQREFVSKSEEERSDMNTNTVYQKWSRLKSRVQAGMWDFGLLFSEIDGKRLQKWYDGPEPRPSDYDNISRISLSGFADHAANVVAFLYRVLPYPVFLRSIEAGIYRAERYGEDRRMLNVNVSSDAIERTYAPTEENQDKYDIDALRDKLQSGESLDLEERMALANALEYYENSREVTEDEERFSHRSD